MFFVVFAAREVSISTYSKLGNELETLLKQKHQSKKNSPMTTRDFTEKSQFFMYRKHMSVEVILGSKERNAVTIKVIYTRIFSLH